MHYSTLEAKGNLPRTGKKLTVQISPLSNGKGYMVVIRDAITKRSYWRKEIPRLATVTDIIKLVTLNNLEI